MPHSVSPSSTTTVRVGTGSPASPVAAEVAPKIEGREHRTQEQHRDDQAATTGQPDRSSDGAHGHGLGGTRGPRRGVAR